MARLVALALLLVSALLVASVVVPAFAVAGMTPDVVLLTVVGLALADGAATGARYGFVAGLAVDALSGASAPFGLSALVLVLAGYAVGAASPYLSSSGRAGHLAAVGLAAAGTRLLYGLLAGVLDVGHPDPELLLWSTLGTTLYTLLLAPLVLPAVLRLSRRFAPAATLAN